MSLEKNNNQNKIDNKILLKELANDISSKFWIDKNKTESLIKSETIKDLDSLKTELQKNNETDKKLNNKEVEKLFFSLKWAQEIIENSSKIEIKTLKEDIEKSIAIEDFKNHIEDYLPAKLLSKAKDPKNLHEHILWFALWTTNSIIATADILYQIWAWIIKAPYHIYMIISWKAKTESFKNI